MQKGGQTMTADHGQRAPTGGRASQPGQEVVGSWITRVSGPAAMLLYTFTADGGLTATHGQHTRRSSAHGAWERTGDRRFLAKHVSLLFDEQGNVRGTMTLRLDITVDPDGNRFTSRNIREAHDLEGNRTERLEATGEATRITPSPLD
jgi:hypothetical protein